MLKNPKKVKDGIIDWIQDYFEKNGPRCTAVVGISGGKDSTIVAALCAEALGKERVLGVMMPDTEQDADSKRVIDLLGIPSITIPVGGAISVLKEVVGSNVYAISQQAIINIPPRVRMTTLYAVSQSLVGGGRVANTCNYSEDYVGYSTKFGDSAGDFAPIAKLTVSEVKQIGYELGLPTDLVDKTPSDGLCGMTDEDNLGFTYAQLEDYIKLGTCGIMSIDYKISELHRRNLHKLFPMPSFTPDRGVVNV